MKNPMKEAYVSNVLYGDSYTLRKFKEADEYDFDEEEIIEDTADENVNEDEVTEDNEEENEVEEDSADRETKLDALADNLDALEDWKLEINSKTDYTPLDVKVSREKNGVVISFVMDDVINEDEQDIVDEEFTSAMTDEIIKAIDGVDFDYDVDGSNTVRALFW